MLTDELHAYLFDGQPNLLSSQMAIWLASSRRFTAFAATNRDKIRKKIRVTQDHESLLDLRLELETAYLLLRQRTLSLVYEPQQAQKTRGPDYAVTYTTSLTFMVEVTRVRAEQKDGLPETLTQDEATPMADPNLPTTQTEERVADAICSKLGQLLPQQSNVLVVGVEALEITNDSLQSAMLHIQQRAERYDEAFELRYRFRNRADFFRHYQRLSEVVVRGPEISAAEPIVVWVNPQAKHPLPGKVRTAVYHSHTAP